MAHGFPSMTALLGLLAVAGYQNRDKISEMLRGAIPSGSPSIAPNQQTGGLGGLLSSLQGMGAGGLLSGGLSELLERFTQNGQGSAARSWVSTGPNTELSSSDLRTAIGSDVLETLEQQTGLSQEELLARLSRELPNAVDKYTPQGMLPDPARS